MNGRRKAVILSSGGIDSTTAMAMAKQEGFDLYSLSFDYGQRHTVELEAANRVSEALGARRHLVIRIDLRAIGGSALTADIAVPHGRSDSERAAGIPVTYVPARNTVFLSYALAWAEVLEASDIFIGVNAVDYSGYPDCRPEYIAAFERMANLATKAAIEGKHLAIHAPLIQLSKAGIIEAGTRLGVDYSLTVSCYQADDEGCACGVCDSCRLRRAGFEAAGIPDPTRYRSARQAPHRVDSAG